MQQEKVDLLIEDVMILKVDGEKTFIPRGSIAVDGGDIVAIGEEVNYTADRVIKPERGLALPGLINCHMHSTLTRGICEDLKLMDWLEQICFPLDAAYTPEIMKVSAALNQLEMIKSGTTTFVDIYRHPVAVAEVLLDSGLRGFLTPQVIDKPQGVGETLKGNVDLYHQWHGKGKGRINVWFGVHAPYSNTVDTYRQAREYADKFGVGVHTHLAETAEEVDDYRRDHGSTPVEFLHKQGVLGDKFLAAHCVHLTPHEMEILARTGVTAIYNPTSNMKLAAGTAPIPDLIDKGVRVTLGTDSNLSNNNLDMLEEMKIAGLLQKLQREDPTALPVYQLLEMATIKGAEALGIADITGSLETGKRADIVIMDFNSPHLWPLFTENRKEGFNNVVEHIVYSAGGADVETVIVDGEVLMENNQVKTLDPDSIYQGSQRMSELLCKRAGLI